MQVRVTIAWKLVFVARGAPEPRGNNAFFNTAPNPGYIRQFSVIPDRALIPTILTPTVTFHRIAHHFADPSLQGRATVGRLPYLLKHPIIGQVKLKLKCREYLPGILAMTAALEPCTVTLDSPRQLILLQSLNHTTGLLYNYITATLGLWASRPDLKVDTAADTEALSLY